MRNSLRIALLLLAAIPAFAQTSTGTLGGRVAAANGAPLPGVLVTVTSPALQGARSRETSADGAYLFPALPPGTYRVTFAMSGMQTVARAAELHVGQLANVDVEMRVMIAEEITVVQANDVAMETPQVATNLAQEVVNALPIGRGILDVARLAAGVHDSGPGNHLTINGAQSTDNLFVVDGAVVSENRRNQPQNLFIEDAIQETTVLTAAISAEYGRFTGGVVSVVTKSGGNEWSGSARDTLTSDRWNARTPAPDEGARFHDIDQDFEATAGGRIVPDRLWVFAAGRSARRRENRTTITTREGFVRGNDEQRYELKLTGNAGVNHTLVATYTHVALDENNLVGGNAAGDLRALYDLEEPQTLLAGHYSGLFGPSVVEAQYTRRDFDLRGGPTDRSRVGGTVFFDLNTNALLNAAPSCGACNRVYHDNHELLVKSTTFLSSPRFGTHSIVAGANDFHELASDDPHSSASDFYVFGTTVNVNGQTYLQVEPEESFIEWYPVLLPSRGSDFGTTSLYVNDRIDWGRRLTFNAGLRYDRSHGSDQGGAEQAKDSRWSPRLGVVVDLLGDGRHRVSASLSRYAAKVDQFVAIATSPAGDSGFFGWTYEGDPINDGSGPYLSADEVLRQVFAWFDSVGGTENRDLAYAASTGGLEALAGDLQAPVMDETTLGYGRDFGSAATARVDLIRRRWHDFYAYRLTPENARVIDLLGRPANEVLIENSDAGLRRDYEGLVLQGSWRHRRIVAGGNYTLSRLQGNVEQETLAGVVTIRSPEQYLHEYNGYAAYAPMGSLSGDERHRANAWMTYEVPTALGRFSFSLLETYHSARAFNVIGNVDTRAYVKNPGYVNPVTRHAYYFRPRGSLRLDDISSTSVALNYSRTIGAVEAFIETDLTNAFNEQHVENSFVSQNVRTALTDRNLAPFNPFTSEPVECPQGMSTASPQCKGVANYQLPANLGQPTSKAAYQQPRTFRFSFGVRF
ncbi:MAG TPA: carboxypeptidase regulatory-like domain-containing protein [Thermoanaerobaculia bacterium]|jgi:hypothetical protein